MNSGSTIQITPVFSTRSLSLQRKNKSENKVQRISFRTPNILGLYDLQRPAQPNEPERVVSAEENYGNFSDCVDAARISSKLVTPLEAGLH
jgi:hypothetical protein